MSKFINKVVTGVSTLALAASMLVMPFATTSVHAAMAGEVYKTTDGTVWFITDGMQKRPFTSAGAFLSYGFLSFSQVKEADATVTALPTGSFIAPQDGRIFCATETKASDVKGECSLITGGKKAAFTSSAVFTGQGYSFARAYYGDSSFLEKTSNVDNASAQHRPGTLINNNGTIQLVVTGGLWGTPSMDVFNSWGWNIADVVPANSADVLLSQTGVISARTAGQLSPSATTAPVDNGPLEGTVGAVESYQLAGGLANEEVGEDEEDVMVAGLEIEAGDDSDLRFTALKLVFDEGTAASDFEDYASEVSVMLGDTEIARVDADEFNDDNSWTKTLALDSDAIIRMGDTETMYVSVSGISNLDSGDAGDTWTVDFRSIRFEDAQGASTTEDPTEDPVTFSFQSFATAADIELVISEVQDVNDARMINVDDVDDTDDVEILAFTMEVEGDSDIMIDSLPVTINTVEATGNDPDDIIATYYLYMGDTEVGSESNPATDVTDDSTSVVVFDDLDVEVAAGETEDFSIKVDFYSIADTLDAGDTVQAVFGETQTDLATFEAEDEEGNDLADGDKTGTVTGGAHELRDIGFNAELVEVDADISSTSDGTAGVSDAGTFIITFDVTAFDGDVYIDKSAPLAAGGSGEADLGITGTGTVVATITSGTGATEGTDGFLVEEGTTERFTVTTNITATASGFFAVELDDIVYALTDADGGLSYDFGLEDYKTGQIFLRDF